MENRPEISGNPSSLNYSKFNPVDLGEFIRNTWEDKQLPFVTFLLGAGCSKSAGIPLAGEIVKELRDEAKTNPFLRNAGNPPQGISEYAYLMERLGSPLERAKRIKKYVDHSRDDKGRIRINWTHLLLSAMVEKGYINRILTTNFDPLIVEALAVMGQPIRTYDLNSSGKYYPGTLDSASIIYLHGQVHSLFLANSPEEMRRLEALYPSVLQEAVQDSLLIVIGYSGNCDPVLNSLQKLPNFPCGLWWSHYGTTESELGDGVQRLFQNFGKDCHLAEGDDSDTFMRKLVLEGMKLNLPDEVLTPIKASRLMLERITPFPIKDFSGGDPVRESIEDLNSAEQYLGDQRSVKIGMAAISEDWNEFNKLRHGISPNPDSRISQAIGDGLLQLATKMREKGDFDSSITLLIEANAYGLKESNRAWLPTIWGNSLIGQAILKGDSDDGNRLFAEAYQKFSEALQIKPDMHEAFCNWGVALSNQATSKDDTEDGNRLFAEAYQKFAEALRIKPEKYEALNNWGAALIIQASLKKDKEESIQLFEVAYQKLTEALLLKPDYQRAYYNIACLEALRGDAEKSVEQLELWAKYDPAASRKKLDKDSDFDKVRNTPEFQSFREKLPE